MGECSVMLGSVAVGEVDDWMQEGVRHWLICMSRE